MHGRWFKPSVETLEATCFTDLAMEREEPLILDLVPSIARYVGTRCYAPLIMISIRLVSNSLLHTDKVYLLSKLSCCQLILIT